MGKLSDKAAQLRKECLSILSSGMANAQLIESYNSDYKGFYLPCEYSYNYDAFIFIDNRWELLQNGYLYSTNCIDIETLCKYVEQVIQDYKLCPNYESQRL